MVRVPMEGSEAAQQKDSVKVVVNIRPLITPELLLGCTDCVTVTPGEPQVSICLGTSLSGWVGSSGLGDAMLLGF